MARTSTPAPHAARRAADAATTPAREVQGLIAKGEIVSGPTLIGLLIAAAHLS